MEYFFLDLGIGFFLGMLAYKSLEKQGRKDG
jgi:hypothetical protein